MKLYSYIINHDTGFSPNPFYGVCTLACCKPVIRRCSNIGDWVIGLSPRRHGNKLIYAMKIEEKLSFEQYWHDNRFKDKKFNGNSVVGKNGDNIYEPLLNGEWKQHPSFHTTPRFTEKENEDNKRKDLSGVNVLVSKTFVYFGRSAKLLPSYLAQFLPAGRGHKSNFPPDVVEAWNAFIEDVLASKSGMVDNPRDLPERNENNTKPKRC